MAPKKATQKAKCTNGTLEAVAIALGELHELIKPKKNGARTKAEDNLDNEHLTKGLDLLKSAVEELTNVFKKEKKETEELAKKIRVTEDEVDSEKQKNLKGRFVITGADTLVKTEEQLKQDNKKLPAHITNLAKLKYNVDIPEADITTCYHLKKGGIIIYLKNQTENSAFQKLVDIIKSNKSNKDVNLYFNFMLTRKRSRLLFDIRQMRRETENLKYYTDENGTISLQVPNSQRKKRVTRVFNESLGGHINFNIDEIKEEIKEGSYFGNQ